MRLLRLALALTVALLVAPPAATAAAAPPVLGLTFADSPARPHVVPASGTEGFLITVSTSAPATNVTVHAEGEGLTVENDPVILPELERTTGPLHLLVAARNPGFHTLTVTVTADGADPVTGTLPHLWTPGGEPIPADGDLTGRAYGWKGLVSVDEYRSHRARTMLTFVDRHRAYVGLPPRGVPGCPAPGCVPYSYDTATGFVQVGDDMIGEVLGPRLFIENLTPTDHGLWPNRIAGPTLEAPVAAPRHRRYDRTWSATERAAWVHGLAHQRLSLNRNGTFRLSFAYGDNPRRRMSGRYDLGRRGHLVLRGRRGKVLHGTLLVRESLSGVPKPGTLGVWLVLELHRRNGTVVDGNPLRPE